MGWGEDTEVYGDCEGGGRGVVCPVICLCGGIKEKNVIVPFYKIGEYS